MQRQRNQAVWKQVMNLARIEKLLSRLTENQSLLFNLISIVSHLQTQTCRNWNTEYRQGKKKKKINTAELFKYCNYLKLPIAKHLRLTESCCYYAGIICVECQQEEPDLKFLNRTAFTFLFPNLSVSCVQPSLQNWTKLSQN